MALAKGESKVLSGPISLHTETAIHISEQITSVRLFFFYEHFYCSFEKAFSFLSFFLFFKKK